ncbi:MAG: hypothetical protein JXA71_19655 [Chitinispirillaceae bacterium]|nr:hypothetical protein [Chitinispirillaceae bacterium]
MATKKITAMVTAFRDGFQSVYGARVFTKDFMPAVAAARNAGISYFEAGGGAMFQSAYFYCNEDAFAQMDEFRKTAGPEANLQTLARGVNVVCLDSQPRAIIKLHAELFKKHGISTIRNFDALNDVDNLIYSGQCIHDAGLRHQVAVTMMELPPGCNGAHTPEFYTETLRKILDAGIPYDSVCFKDASGSSVPSKVFETIRQARQLVPQGTKIHFHSHETAGIGLVQYMAALDAGADAIDLSLAPVSGGTCQTDIITMWHALRGTDYDLGIDIDKMVEAEEIFKECMKDYFVPPEARTVEPLIILSPMPGGALTANTQMLRDNGLMNRYPEMIKAMSEVVRRGGFGTSVTPVSQFYFQQAYNNVMSGPWKKIAEGYGKMVLGYFGKTPVAPDKEIIEISSVQLSLPPITEKTVDIDDRDPKKGVAAAKKMLTDAGITDLSDENIFIAAACKDKGVLFLKGEARIGVRKIEAGKPASAGPAATASDDVTVTINGKPFTVRFENGKATVNGVGYDYEVKVGTGGPARKQEASAGATNVIASPLPGVVLRIAVAPAQKVVEGQTLFVVEAMKMETEVKAPRSGAVISIAVSPGDQVATGQELAKIQ